MTNAGLKLLITGFLLFDLPAGAQQKTKGKIIHEISSQDKVTVHKFTPQKGFHINEKAPAHYLSSAENSKKISPLVIHPQKIEFSLSKKPADSEQGQFKFYVCDDKNTVCEPHSYSEKSNVDSDIKQQKKETINPDQGNSRKVTRHNGFILDDFNQALKLAKDKQKLLFIDFRASWCPPCIRLEKEVFNQKSFQKYANSYVFLSIDVDREDNYPLVERFQIKAFPTLVILDNQENEIHRILDYLPLKNMNKYLNEIAKNKPMTLSKLTEKAELGDKASMILLAESLFDAYRFEEAINWYEKANLINKKYFLAKIEVSKKNLETSKNQLVHQDVLRQALITFPESYSSVGWYFELAKSVGGQHKEYNDLIQKSLALADKWTQDPKLIQNLRKNESFEAFFEFEKAELFAKKAEVFEELKNKDSAKLNWQLAAEEALKLNPNVNKPTHLIYLTYYLKQFKKPEEVDPWYLKLEKQYPDEFTYPHRRAKLWYEAKDPATALPYAERAFSLAYGSNKLTAANLLAKIKIDLNQKPQAKFLLQELLDSELAKSPRNKNQSKALQKILDDLN